MRILVPLFALAAFAVAQEIETVPLDKAQEIARKLTAEFGAPADAPFAVQVDTEKPSGIKGGNEAGLLALPDKKLTADAIANAGKNAVAIGQLWMRKVVPSVGGAAPDPAKLRRVTFGEGDSARAAECYFLGVTKTDAGAIELSIFGKDKEPLVKVPLMKTDAAADATPIALTGRKETENSGVLVITLFGSYKADVTVTKPRE